MVEKTEDGKRYAVCDCCFEHSFYYDTEKELRKGLKYEGWYNIWNAEEHGWITYCVECKEGR